MAESQFLYVTREKLTGVDPLNDVDQDDVVLDAAYSFVGQSLTQGDYVKEGSTLTTDVTFPNPGGFAT